MGTLAALGGLSAGITQGRLAKSEIDKNKALATASKTPTGPVQPKGIPEPLPSQPVPDISAFPGGGRVQLPPEWSQTGIPNIVPTPKPIAHKGGRITKTGTYRMKEGEIVIPVPSKKRSTRKTGRKSGRKSGR